jgi:hypothetical protein
LSTKKDNLLNKSKLKSQKNINKLWMHNLNKKKNDYLYIFELSNKKFLLSVDQLIGIHCFSTFSSYLLKKLIFLGIIGCS